MESLRAYLKVGEDNGYTCAYGKKDLEHINTECEKDKIIKNKADLYTLKVQLGEIRGSKVIPINM